MPEKILVVDDDPYNAELLFSFLQAKGFDVAMANNGERAYKVALNFKPDLVLMDILMPGWNGYETAKVFKSDPQLQDISIIFVTAKMEEAEKAFGIGAADYIIKPFNNIELLARVKFQLCVTKRWLEVQQNNVNLKFSLTMKEHELTKAKQQIADLKQRLKKESPNVVATSEVTEEQKRVSDEAFEKQINQP